MSASSGWAHKSAYLRSAEVGAQATGLTARLQSDPVEGFEMMTRFGMGFVSSSAVAHPAGVISLTWHALSGACQV